MLLLDYICDIDINENYYNACETGSLNYLQKIIDTKIKIDQITLKNGLLKIIKEPKLISFLDKVLKHYRLSTDYYNTLISLTDNKYVYNCISINMNQWSLKRAIQLNLDKICIKLINIKKLCNKKNEIIDYLYDGIQNKNTIFTNYIYNKFINLDYTNILVNYIITLRFIKFNQYNLEWLKKLLTKSILSCNLVSNIVNNIYTIDNEYHLEIYKYFISQCIYNINDNHIIIDVYNRLNSDIFIDKNKTINDLLDSEVSEHAINNIEKEWWIDKEILFKLITDKIVLVKFSNKRYY